MSEKNANEENYISIDEAAEYPDLWEKLKTWDRRTWRKIRADYSVEELEVRFDFEEECVRAGKPTAGKAFFTELRKRLEVTSHDRSE